MNGAAYTVEIAFSDALTGIFTLDISSLDGPDLLGTPFGGATFADVTAEVEAVSIARGRPDDLSPMDAGTCTVTLLDKDGKYNPLNTTSPLYGQIKPLRPLRIRATYQGATHGLFYGFLRSSTSSSDLGRQEAELHFVDLFVVLSRGAPIIAAAGPTTTGAAIGLILDALGWTEAAMRRLADGDAIPDFAADGSKTALTLIADLLESSRGVFYVDGDGVAVHEDRYYRSAPARLSSQSTIAGTATYLDPGVDLDSIRNRARVQRTGGALQEAVDLASSAAYGLADYPAFETPYLVDDAQAARLARWLVEQRAEGTPRIGTLELVDAEPTAFAALLTRDLMDRVTVTAVRGGTAGDFHVEAIKHELRAPSTHSGTWTLSPRPLADPFVLDTSFLDSLDALVY